MTFARSPVMPKTTSTSAGCAPPVSPPAAERAGELVAVVMRSFRRVGVPCAKRAQALSRGVERKGGGPASGCGARHTRRSRPSVQTHRVLDRAKRVKSHADEVARTLAAKGAG